MSHPLCRPLLSVLTAVESRRWRPLLRLLLTTFLISGLGWAAVTMTHPVAAQDTKTATIVVQPDDSSTLGRRISFTDPISGLGALELSGLSVVTVTTGFGPAICSINGVGCPADDCFCSTSYWAYSYWDGAGWQSYPVGAGSSLITDTGAIEGWRWGEFGTTQLPPTTTVAALAALDWLADQADETTGGFANVSENVEALIAFGANLQTERVAGSGSTLLGQASSYAAFGPASAGKLAVALAAADACLPVTALTPMGHYSSTLGSFSTQSGPQSWAILGAIAAGETLPPTAADALMDQAQAGGGWGWSGVGGVDTNTTALAIQALIAAGHPPTTTVIVEALARLKTAQRADGGFSYGFDIQAESDANSTAYVIQAIVAVGQDLTAPVWTQNGQTPLDYLLARQQPDGALEWQVGTGGSLLATTQAIPALLGRSHPLAAGVDRCPAVMLPIVTNVTTSAEQ